MTSEQYASLQKIIEEQEKNKTTGKIIIFFENGKIKGVETTNKIRLIVALLDENNTP